MEERYSVEQTKLSELWTVHSERDVLYIQDPHSETRVYINDPTNIRFARALCHVLNSTPIHKLHRTMEEMTSRGIPNVN
jgi:hypothetical protein